MGIMIPTAIATKAISTAATVGKGLAAFSAIKGFQNQRNAAKAQKQANQAAMAAAQKEAELTRRDAEYRAGEEKKDAARVRSQQIAAFLKSGVTLDGTPLLIADDTTKRGEENAQNILENAGFQSDSITLKGKASQQPVTRPDFFGTVAQVATAGQKLGQ